MLDLLCKHCTEGWAAEKRRNFSVESDKTVQKVEQTKDVTC